MVLVDTSVWVSHLRDGNVGLEKLLNDGEVVCHTFIVGELACGNLKNRHEILTYLQSLPMAILAEDEEVLKFIENHQLMGKGLGYIDVHLIASSALTDVPL
jgi:predicted nucleic acid-binding protein